jgi:hypothetical protein
MPSHEFVWEETDDQIMIRGAGCQLIFTRLGDRWTHRLAVVRGAGDEALIEVATALESDPERDDPTRVVSPVYQELHRHDLGDDQNNRICLLLTGLSSQHHFSAAVSLAFDPDAPETVLIDFDIADRCRAPVSVLAATYSVRLSSSDLGASDPQSINWQGPALGAGHLELRGEPGTTLALAEGGRNATSVQALATIDATAFTHRLRYRWRWAIDSSLTL